jgi:hypothetical protein
MSALELVARLNRRHKAALWATLVCVGLVLMDSGIRDGLGIGCLGIAFAWALGSNYRPVHWLFVVSGLLLLVPAVGDVLLWPRQKAEAINLQQSIIQSDLEGARQEQTPSEKLKDYRDLQNERDQMRSLQTEGRLRHAMKLDWQPTVGGLLLLCSGVGLLLGVRPPRRASEEVET